uniref:Uncharacterized protein n=1 Tax=Lactuca sativa TaxID=4236 RepID=A0A9R1XBD5_LACSA|nr:hypothetical protein LSAT_V11C500229000 [Lactuca sativa]
MQTWCGCYLGHGKEKQGCGHSRNLCASMLLAVNLETDVLLNFSGPKKKRTKSIVEKEDFVRGNTTSRAHRSITSNKCNNVSHNARTLKGKILSVGGSSGKSKVIGKWKGKATT